MYGLYGSLFKQILFLCTNYKKQLISNYNLLFFVSKKIILIFPFATLHHYLYIFIYECYIGTNVQIVVWVVD